MYHPFLPTFLCAAEAGSFNQAAERLYLSPPAVMKQINALEKYLGLKLFIRSSQGLSLTSAGEIVRRYAEGIIGESEKALSKAREAENASSRAFCIGSSILNPCRPFMDIWYRINGAFPDYKLHIVPFEDDHAGILSEISALGTKFDFLVGVCDSALWLDRCRFLKLGSYQHCIAVSREHRLAGKKRIAISDLFGETVMLVKKGDSKAVDAVRALLSRYPKIKLEDTPQFYDIGVFNRCEATRQVLLTVECWADVHPSLVTIPVRWDFPVAYGILYPLHPDEDTKRLIALLSQTVSEEDARTEN